MHRSWGSPRLAAAAVVAALALAACGAGEAASPESPAPTVGEIGDLPGELRAQASAPPNPTTTSTEVDTTVAPRPATPGTIVGDTGYRFPIGRTIDGNRLLVIGDSILASISDRYGGQLCDRLVPMGWVVEADAESGRDVTFGLEVLDDRLDAGWDGAVVLLGNNYRDDPVQFRADLEEIVRRLAPRPTVLLTVTEFQPSRADVNEAIRAIGEEYENVRVVDWAERTRDAAELLGADGLHLSEQGRLELATQIARPLQRYKGIGECLDSDYDDDSRAPDVDLGDGDDGDDGWTPPPDPDPTPDPDPDPTPDTTITPEPTDPPATDPPATDPPATDPPPPATDPPPPPPTDPPPPPVTVPAPPTT